MKIPRVTEGLVPLPLSVQEWKAQMRHVMNVMGSGTAARIAAHVCALEERIEQLESTQAPQQDPRQR
jgi:hypothetical protein